MKLLIVDDIAANLRLLRAQLESEGHAVLEAGNGVEALKVLEQERADAVVSDILMPNMDGFQLCLEIRRSETLCALPFVLYTSTYNSPSDRTLARSVGADAYITKPAPVSVILDAVRAALQTPRDTARPALPGHDESYVLKQYSEALVRKLEDKNLELQEALDKLQAANAEILDLNRNLETRVRQRTIDLESANRELESFSYSVSHDLRAPLRGISGFSDILQRDYGAELPPEARRLIGRVQEQAGEMRALIDALLEFARMGRKAPSPQPLSLAHLARECLKELAPEREGRNVEIVIGELPPARGDLILLKQVLLNLLSNALKYTRKRDAARIEVAAEQRGNEVICRVGDNGAGFDMRHADKLFEVFQRLHSQGDFPGTGVGLAIVKRIVEKHGGRVWAESARDEGTTFYFSLPSGSADGND